MAHLVDKDRIVAEVERQIELLKPFLGACAGQIVAEANDKLSVLEWLKNFLDTLEVKEVDLEKECRNFIKSDNGRSMLETAKHFFELGLSINNPITEENLESFVRQVIDLDIEAGKYYNNIIKEERKENKGSDLMINLLCGTIDAKELGIQYVLKKLKAQKGE